jgi:hypothetical protein
MNAKTEIVQAETSEVATRNVSDTAPILEIISRAASDPSVDIEKMERLMLMHERLVDKQNETAFNNAMTAAQSEMVRVSADAVNPQTRSKYASYAALDRALRPIYTAHGFALSFDEGDSPKTDHVRVLCHVSHRMGFSKTYHKDMPADGKGAKGGDVMTKTHAAGSAMSYGMRYLLKGIFNVAVGTDDDDGNAASYPTITEKQVADLEALIEEVGSKKTAFMKYCKVSDLNQILAKNYHFAVQALEAKRKA